ncbi:MAG: helix-turn-helix domain-containing protein [Tannerella sp.]|jgi:AraC-like DNA-binding protein|nr:helix-turn-helix domain-containing protein [Tannerella sp.]
MQHDWYFMLIFFSYSLRAFAALFWGIFQLAIYRRSIQNLPFGVIFTVIGLLYLRNAFIRLPALEACDVYNPLSYLVLIFIAPFAIFYVWFAFEEVHSKKDYLIHFIPFVLVVLLWGGVELSAAPHIPFCYSINELLGYMQQYPIYVIFFLLLMVVFIAQVITYFSIALAKILQIRKIYKSHGLSVRPQTVLIVMDCIFLIYPLVCVVFMSYNNVLLFGVIFSFVIVAAITTVSVLNINLILPLKTDLGFIEDYQYQNITIVHTETIDAEQKSPDEELIEKIITLFEEKEIYRLPHLTLQDVVVELGTNRTYASAYINRHFGCNFKQLLMRYRIAASKKLLQHSSLDIATIAYEAGFNTRTSFYRAFNEHVDKDLSPSEWRKVRVKEQVQISL